MSNTSVCRICLRSVEPEKLKNLCNTFLDSVNYAKIFEFCIGSALNVLCHLPELICPICERNLLNSFAFKKQCLATEEIIRQQQCNTVSKNIAVDEHADVGITADEDDIDDSPPEFIEEEEYINYEEEEEEIDEEEEEERIENEEAFTSEELAETTTEPATKDKQYSNDSETKRRTKLKSYRAQTTLCPLCGKLVKNYYLPKHMISHENIPHEERPFECDICGTRFKAKDTLRGHQRTHTKEKKYECPYCNEKFLYWSTKKLHISTYHTGEAKFQCNVCDAKFCISSMYKKHIKIHTGENIRKYPCRMCEKQFESNYKLRLHQTVHSDERNVKCEYCDKTYKTIKSLRVHLRNHTGEKNYICPVCSVAFTQNLLLKSHVLKNHPNFKLPPAGTIISKKYLEKLATKVL